MFDLTLKNVNIITPYITIEDGFVSIIGKKIALISGKENYVEHCKKKRSKKEIDLKSRYMAPGFFDIHTHGGAGILHNEINNLNELEKITSLSASEGVTSFLPTLAMTSIKDKFDDFISRVNSMSRLIKKAKKGAKPIGINLELFMLPTVGCFASGAKGAGEVIPKPTVENWKRIKKDSKDTVKIVTVAPEWGDGLDLISELRMDGVIPSIGHTLASEEILDEAIRRGASLVTHLLNTTYQPKQDQLGVVVPGVNEYLLNRDDIMSELIVDKEGAHIHPTMLKIAIKCLGIDRVITITDATHTRGTNIKKFERDGVVHTCNGNVNRKPNGHLSGSAVGMNEAVKSLIKHTGVSIDDAIKTASSNPAKLLGIYKDKGSIEVGKDADLIVFNDNIDIRMTIVEGKIVYNNLEG